MDGERIARVFISSAFLDMEKERSTLANQVFPELKYRCRQIGVEFMYVDFRWGITDDQTADGELIPLCFRAIDKCRPFFVGMLGEYYGRAVDKIDKSVLADYPWLSKNLYKSITEIEMLYGALNNPESAASAFFYFRDPACCSDVFEIADTDHRKMNRLKNRIRSSNLNIFENFCTPENLCKILIQDLWQAIIKAFPSESFSNGADNEAPEHYFFAKSRTRVFIDSRDYFASLDAHIDSSKDPIIITGEPGSGKSALLGNWVFHRHSNNPSERLFYHFVGSTPNSANFEDVILRFMRTVKSSYGVDESIPNDSEDLIEAFPNWLSMASVGGQLVLVFDGIDQLEDGEKGLYLSWLPENMPPKVRLVLSSLPGRYLDVLSDRGWKILTIHPLDLDERIIFMRRYLLELYSKSISSEQLEVIAQFKQCSNPLFLKVLIEEIKVIANHGTLSKIIDEYLTASDSIELYQLVLKRLEENHDKYRLGLIRDALSAIWSSRRGVMEAEILELLDVEKVLWLSMLYQLDESLISRSGYMNFFHRHLREAVQRRYLLSNEKQIQAHSDLASFFKKTQDISRKIDEFPWQLCEAGLWDELFVFLSDPKQFEYLYSSESFDQKRYWTLVESNSYHRLEEGFRSVIDQPGIVSKIENASQIGYLLKDKGRMEEAALLQNNLIELCEQKGYQQYLHIALGDRANISFFVGKYDEAFSLFERKEKICRLIGDNNGLQSALGNKANIHHMQGNYELAIALHTEEEKICLSLGDKRNYHISIGNKALSFFNQNDYDKALALLKEQEHICMELGDSENLQRNLGNQANIYRKRGNLKKAMELTRLRKETLSSLGNEVDILNAAIGEANILYYQDNLDESLAIFKEVESRARVKGYKQILATALGDEANILIDQHQFAHAYTLSKEQEDLSLELGLRPGLEASYGNQAEYFLYLGDTQQALNLLQKKEEICRDLGYKEGLARSLKDQATILFNEFGQPDEALLKARESHDIAKEIELTKIIDEISVLLKAISLSGPSA